MFSIIATILGFLLSFFKKKAQGEAAIDTVIAEKDKVISEVQDAKNLRDNLSDDDIARVQSKFERQD